MSLTFQASFVVLFFLLWFYFFAIFVNIEIKIAKIVVNLAGIKIIAAKIKVLCFVRWSLFGDYYKNNTETDKNVQISW